MLSQISDARVTVCDFFTQFIGIFAREAYKA